VISSLLSVKAAAVALAITAATGTAAAATVNLPGVADDHASGATGNAADHQQDSAGAPGGANHGDAVSTLATTTTLTGRDKGAAISALASGGRSQAGAAHGQSASSGRPSGAEDQASHASGSEDATDGPDDSGTAGASGSSATGGDASSSHTGTNS
jgi:hypothetical protein